MDTINYGRRSAKKLTFMKHDFLSGILLDNILIKIRRSIKSNDIYSIISLTRRETLNEVKLLTLFTQLIS